MKSERKARAGRAEFVLAKLGKGCWVVGYQGRLSDAARMPEVARVAVGVAGLRRNGEPVDEDVAHGGRGRRRWRERTCGS